MSKSKIKKVDSDSISFLIRQTLDSHIIHCMTTIRNEYPQMSDRLIKQMLKENVIKSIIQSK